MLSISRRLAKPRGYEVQTRFHDPDKAAEQRTRIRIARRQVTTRRKTRQPQFIAVGLGLAAAFYLYVNADAVFGNAIEGLSLLFGG